ncbi:AraC family transcriptional regulator [Breznakiella homolactica]|uniref:AraC family transcriptional regulator n=1 Tax=Breznakiella homolactica TaxID=2798577 RepID=A0A7T7XLV1_9SPIR|nr:AraC family transcriptional regulator [Breznakiella homolactica]QQO08746.1 AraC family transcriptional regulator [Breznakiella homolactica]
MDWLGRFNGALRYVEDNLDGDIDPDQLARIAGCSGFHFQRMFSYMAGMPLSEYIRRRRMTRAAFDLQNGDEKVIDIALRYGYDSPTAFNRAFRNVHGAAPSAARRKGIRLKAYHPISFKITIRGEAEMNYRIEDREAFRIVGAKMETDWNPEKQEGFVEVPKFWVEQKQKGIIPELCGLMDNKLPGILGVCVGDWQKPGKLEYYIAVSSGKSVPKGMAEYQVPACTWAIFECIGPMPGAIQKIQERIMTEWFPGSGYEYADGPDIEVYSDGDQSAEDYVCWIWVPVKK